MTSFQSPALAHKKRVQAERAALAAASAGAELSTEYELALANLDQQLRALKSTKSMVTKTTMKADWLAGEWRTYIDTALSEDSGQPDAILSRLFVWACDTASVDDAMNIGTYLIKHDLPAPDGFTRSMAEVFAEEIAEMALANNEVSVSAEILDEVLDIIDGYDLQDEISAKLHRALGVAYAETDKEKAIEHLKTAIKYNEKVGAKPLLKSLEKALAEVQEQQAADDDKEKTNEKPDENNERNHSPKEQ